MRFSPRSPRRAAAPKRRAAASAEKPAERRPPKVEAPKPAATAGDDGKSITVMVPTLGESVSEATVATWFKKVGDTVAQDEMLCELETDKVSVEVPAPAAGVLTEILADAEGETVAAGGELAVISTGAGAARLRGSPCQRRPGTAAPKAERRRCRRARMSRTHPPPPR
jgi:2-oxoglutarate dehydrogenase E2 component (dihydrolipoamide succinyltransferase)